MEYWLGNDVLPSGDVSTGQTQIHHRQGRHRRHTRATENTVPAVSLPGTYPTRRREPVTQGAGDSVAVKTYRLESKWPGKNKWWPWPGFDNMDKHEALQVLAWRRHRSPGDDHRLVCEQTGKVLEEKE